MGIHSPVFRPSRSKGQCFLRDERYVARIVEAIGPGTDESLIEIGAGEGQLTLPLARAGARLLTIESDPRLAEKLRRAIDKESTDRVELLQEDALTVDFPRVVADRHLGRTRVCGNLPYSVAAPILLRLLAAADSFSELVLMFQSEVADRLTAKPATKEYGFLTVVAQQAAAVRVLFKIPPDAFRPRPRVVSALLRFELRHEAAPEVGDPKLFRRLVRGLLTHRRKTIHNNVKHLGAVSVDPGAVSAALSELRIDPVRRAETLSVEEFAELSRICASRL